LQTKISICIFYIDNMEYIRIENDCA
jgi:hypothetical protein